MLIIFGGLPGTGKTTLARGLAQRIKAVYLRIDTIETAITTSHLPIKKPEDAGYLVGYGLANDNLLLDHTVVADSVNPLPITREGWKKVATSIGKEFIEIEVICSNTKEHQRRVETRIPDIKNHLLPTWEEVQNREYHSWVLNGIRIDTASCAPDKCIDKIIAYLLSL